MTRLPAAWTLLAAALCSSASSQRLLTERVTALYPKLHSNATIQCDCGDHCDCAYWFLTLPSAGRVQFLGRYNNADRVNYGSIERSRYKFSKRGSSTFALQVMGVTEKDTGIYSCVLKDKGNEDMWKPGTLLLPGVAAPASPPVTKPKPPVKKICTCKKNPSADVCGALVLWPLVGLIAGLALAVVCTLYYFSRLPKKCRHQFVKRSR